MPPKRTFAEYMTPEGTPESSHRYTGSTPPTVLTTPPVPTPKRQCHDARARNAKPGHSPENLFGTVPKKPIIDLPRPSRTSAEVRMQLFGDKAFRRVHIPSNYTFVHLHHLTLFLFGWTGVHAHRFSVQNNIIMHPLKRGQVRSGSLFIDVSPPRPPPSKREKREAKRFARALAKSNLRENPSDDSDTDWEGPGAWRPLVLDQESVRQRSEEALTIGEVFGAHVCRRGRAIIYEYDPTHEQGFKVHITLIDLIQHDEPDQLSSPPAWPALPPLPPSSPIRSIASSPYTPRGRLLASDAASSSSPAGPSTRSRSLPARSFEDEEEEDLPQRPRLKDDRTNKPWVVMGQGLPPPERQLSALEDENPEEPGPSTKPALPKRPAGKARKKEAGLSLRSKCEDMDADLFNDGPDGEEGTGFARWLAGELVVERQGEVLLVRDKTRMLERAREIEHAKSAGWDSDEDDEEPAGYPEEHQPQEAVSVEPLPEAEEPYEGDAADEHAEVREVYEEEPYEGEDQEEAYEGEDREEAAYWEQEAAEA